MREQRYQSGDLRQRKRNKGPDVWQFRWIENGKRRSKLIGTIEDLPSKLDAERRVGYYRIKVNEPGPHSKLVDVTVGELIDRYLAEEIGNVRKDTADTYRTNLEKWIRPKWGSKVLESVKSLEVKTWLKSLELSPCTKSHLRNLFHRLFYCAGQWDITEKNPLEFVKQSNRRLRIPRALDADEFHKLLQELAQPYRTMVLVAGCLGLRASEILGLQWGDIDWGNLIVWVQRSAVGNMVYDTKTEASAKPLPLDPRLAEALLNFRREATHVATPDYIFAGRSGKPRWRGVILTDHIKPAALRAGIGEIGWHTFRHTFSSLLHNGGTTMAVQKELLRHANIATTMNLYTQAASPAKREAVQMVAGMLFDA